ncbi:MAG: hypothetical protein QM750_19990 [Rubrivivax sp.]
MSILHVDCVSSDKDCNEPVRQSSDRFLAGELALRMCLDAMLRMIPGYCDDTGAEQCTDEDQDKAVEQAAIVIYGSDIRRWPAAVLKAAVGEYE